MTAHLRCVITSYSIHYTKLYDVPVLGYKTSVLPAFYSNKSPYNVDYKVDSARQIAEMMYAKYKANLAGGMLVANPIPDEYSMDFDEIEGVILTALAEADQKGIHGKDITPFLLDRIQQLTMGESLEANIKLVYNNARLAAEIAIEYRRLYVITSYSIHYTKLYEFWKFTNKF